MKSGCLSAFVGTLLGGAVGLYRAATFVPVGPTSGDGMDKGLGQMGFVLFGLMMGCVLGIIVGAFIKAK